jgi:hypothetical protein
VDGIQGNLCKKVLRIPRNVVKEAAKSELGLDSRRGKILSAATKYWVRVMQSVDEEPVRQCYKWQVGQPRVECWARRLREELDTIRLGYKWQNAREKYEPHVTSSSSDVQSCKDRGG